MYRAASSKNGELCFRLEVRKCSFSLGGHALEDTQDRENSNPHSCVEADTGLWSLGLPKASKRLRATQLQPPSPPAMLLHVST